ncbi:unnamed protein product [Adineta ricciae]|uniref:Uncharacterized protein n=1 Tax=Adineta ricciae TaxID=249248 RepID=A0A815X7Y8_ADIRI|nr:unnamed protein product [Adineta ricciae]CAF1554121.1 unnamed protein product [Adineta ricciae]
MATAAIPPSINDSKSCLFCSTKYDRSRPSICLCQHCSIPLCFECMKQHHDDILQDTAQLSHQYNELRQLFETKKKMIVDETASTIETVNNHFNSYINELLDAQHRIIEELKTTEQQAKESLVDVDSKLQSLSTDIEALSKDGIVQKERMTILSTGMKTLEQRLNNYQVMKTENLTRTRQMLTMSFGYSPTVEEIPSSRNQTNENTQNKVKTEENTSSVNAMVVSKLEVATSDKPLDSVQSVSNVIQPCYAVYGYASDEEDEDEINIKISFDQTPHNIDRIASDGDNILYTSYFDDGCDTIEHFILDYKDGRSNICRDWKQSRIIDLVWWNSIEKFVCVTMKGIYTVQRRAETLKIMCTIKDDWSYARVATNDYTLFLWINSVDSGFNGIDVYSTNFDRLKIIDFNNNSPGSFIDNSTSFCATNNTIVSLCTRTRRNRNVFQATFCNLHMNRSHYVILGKYNNEIEIRSDSEGRLFITTGLNRLHIISPTGQKRTIRLRSNGESIAILNNRRVAIGNGSRQMQIIEY